MTASTDRLTKLSTSRKVALMAYSTREQAMIVALEMIATGTSNTGAKNDLDEARYIAVRTLKDIGWPTVDDVKQARKVKL